MIKKLDHIKHTDNLYDRNGFITNVACGGVVISKVNELIDAINKLKTMAKNTNTVLKSLVEENNIHEKQIDELQMNVEPHKCEPAENTTISKMENVAENGKCAKIAQDPYAGQRRWIGKLCKFWDKNHEEDRIYDILHHIDPNCVYKYCRRELGGGYQHCEPVNPDYDIIYKGE